LKPKPQPPKNAVSVSDGFKKKENVVFGFGSETITTLFRTFIGTVFYATKALYLAE